MARCRELFNFVHINSIFIGWNIIWLNLMVYMCPVSIGHYFISFHLQNLHHNVWKISAWVSIRISRSSSMRMSTTRSLRMTCHKYLWEWLDIYLRLFLAMTRRCLRLGYLVFIASIMLYWTSICSVINKPHFDFKICKIDVLDSKRYYWRLTYVWKLSVLLSCKIKLHMFMNTEGLAGILVRRYRFSFM